MKNLNIYDNYRIPYLGSLGDQENGKFIIPSRTGGGLHYHIIASAGYDWDHVSLSLIDDDAYSLERCPTHEEMEDVKKIFFEPNETATQFHPDTQTLELRAFNKRKCIVKLNEDDYFQRINIALLDPNSNPDSAYPSWDDCCVIKKKIIGENRIGFSLSQNSLILTRGTPSIDIFHSKKEKILTPPSITVGLKSWNI